MKKGENILDLFDENVIPAVIRTIEKKAKETGKDMGEIVVSMIYDESLKPMVRLAAAKITNEILKEADKLEEAIEEIYEKTGPLFNPTIARPRTVTHLIITAHRETLTPIPDKWEL